MSGLKKKISYMFSSGLDRIILTLLNQNLNGFVDEHAGEQLVYILEGKSSKYTSREALECLLKQAVKPTTWPGALRTLMVFHKLTHMQGDILSSFMISNRLDNLAQFSIPDAPPKAVIHSTMVPRYYKYLQRLSYNYRELSICFFPDQNATKQLKENDLSALHFISKVQNIMQYLVGMVRLFEESIQEFDPTDVIRQSAYFCLTDCYYFYTYIGQTITVMLKGMLKIEKQDAILLFELYSEHIEMTKKLKQLFQLKTYLADFSLKIPDFYTVDPGTHERVDNYIRSLKEGLVKAPEGKTQKEKASSGFEIDIDAPHEPNHSGPQNPPSLQELSNVVLQITTPSFKMMQKKELFKPPSLKKASSFASPEMKAISPAGEIQEVQEGLDEDSRQMGARPYSFNPFMTKENIMRMQISEFVPNSYPISVEAQLSDRNIAHQSQEEHMADDHVFPKFGIS